MCLFFLTRSRSDPIVERVNEGNSLASSAVFPWRVCKLWFKASSLLVSSFFNKGSISLYGAPSSSSSVWSLYSSAVGGFFMISSGRLMCSASSNTSVLYRSAIGITSAAKSPYFVPYPRRSSDLFEVPRTRARSVFA